MKFQRKISNKYIIVEEGMSATHTLGEGRMIPGVVLQNKQKDNILKSIIEVHKQIQAGDVVVSWGTDIKNKLFKREIFLNVRFENPIKHEFQIVFNVMEDFSIINAIILSRGLLFGIGFKGDKFSNVLTSGRACIIEVPNTGFDKIWSGILKTTLRKNYKKKGFRGSKLKNAVSDHIKALNEFMRIRVK